MKIYWTEENRAEFRTITGTHEQVTILGQTVSLINDQDQWKIHVSYPLYIEEISGSFLPKGPEYVVVGGYDEKGEENPGMLTFVYKSGAKNKLDAKDFKLRQRKTAACYMDLDSEPLERYT